MPMSAADRNRASRWLVRRLFVDTGATARYSGADLLAAVVAVDNGFDALPPALTQGSSVLANLVNLIETNLPGSTAAEKGLVVACWALAKGGLLTAEF